MIIFLSVLLAISIVTAVLYRRAYRRVLFLTARGYRNSTTDMGGTWYAPDLPDYGVNMLTLKGAYTREKISPAEPKRAERAGTWMEEECQSQTTRR